MCEKKEEQETISIRRCTKVPMVTQERANEKKRKLDQSKEKKGKNKGKVRVDKVDT